LARIRKASLGRWTRINDSRNRPRLNEFVDDQCLSL